MEQRAREFGEANAASALQQTGRPDNAVEMPGLKFGGVNVGGVQLGDISLNLDSDTKRQITTVAEEAKDFLNRFQHNKREYQENQIVQLKEITKQAEAVLGVAGGAYVVPVFGPACLCGACIRPEVGF